MAIKGMEILRKAEAAARAAERAVDGLDRKVRRISSPRVPLGAGDAERDPAGSAPATDPAAGRMVARELGAMNKQLRRMRDDFARKDPFITGGTRPLT